MINLDLIKTILVVSIGSSIISTALIQKIKESLNNKKWLSLMSYILSAVIGMAFTLNFSNLDWKCGVWVGFVTYVGADSIYKAFEDKIFKSFSSMNTKKEDELIGEIPNE